MEAPTKMSSDSKQSHWATTRHTLRPSPGTGEHRRQVRRALCSGWGSAPPFTLWFPGELGVCPAPHSCGGGREPWATVPALGAEPTYTSIFKLRCVTFTVVGGGIDPSCVVLSPRPRDSPWLPGFGNTVDV